MLTINIPVYNIDARPLVFELAKQVKNATIETEIRVYDDGSDEATKTKNRELNKIPFVTYLEMDKNIGRSAIRNKMAKESKGICLLFIDADSAVVTGNYLQNYVDHLDKGRVLCGGTKYSAHKPKDRHKLLRWLYGTKREAISASERNRKKGFIITSNNFITEKELFLKTLFNEKIGPYGHEDTLLGYELFKNGVLPFHIDNPVEHTGLENSATFLNKTQSALKNLLLKKKNIVRSQADFIAQVRFLNRYSKITSFIPAFLLRIFYYLFHRLLTKNLTGGNPQLFWFDVYKLCYFAKIKNREPE